MDEPDPIDALDLLASHSFPAISLDRRKGKKQEPLRKYNRTLSAPKLKSRQPQVAICAHQINPKSRRSHYRDRIFRRLLRKPLRTDEDTSNSGASRRNSTGCCDCEISKDVTVDARASSSDCSSTEDDYGFYQLATTLNQITVRPDIPESPSFRRKVSKPRRSAFDPKSLCSPSYSKLLTRVSHFAEYLPPSKTSECTPSSRNTSELVPMLSISQATCSLPLSSPENKIWQQIDQSTSPLVTDEPSSSVQNLRENLSLKTCIVSPHKKPHLSIHRPNAKHVTLSTDSHKKPLPKPRKVLDPHQWAYMSPDIFYPSKDAKEYTVFMERLKRLENLQNDSIRQERRSRSQHPTVLPPRRYNSTERMLSISLAAGYQ